MPWRSNWALALSLVLSACLGPGKPWGWVEATVAASFQPSEGRLDAEERLITSQDYLVAIDDLSVSFEALNVVMGAAGSAAFDPADPPEGYSLCHNGHCHSAAGELVDYEVIAAELAGGSDALRVTIGLDAEPKVLSAESVGVETVPCATDPCELPMGELAGLELRIGLLRLSGRAFDRREGERARIDAEGVPIEVDLELDQTLLAELSGSVGQGQPIGLNLEAEFQLPPQFLDAVDFAEAPNSSEAWRTILSEALNENGGLVVTQTRIDQEQL